MQLLCESVKENGKTQNSLCAYVPSCVRFVHVRAFMKLHRADTCGTGAPLEEREGHAVIFIFAPGSKTSASRVQRNAAPVTCLHARQMRGHILSIKPACKPGPFALFPFHAPSSELSNQGQRHANSFEDTFQHISCPQ